MRQLLAIIFFLKLVLLFGQKTQILDQSRFKHDYLVSSTVIFESLADTASAKYIATIKVIDVHEGGIIGNSLNILKMKAKELGANMYYVLSYKQDEKNAEVLVRVFFAGEKMVKDNDKNRFKNSVYVFSQFRGNEDSAWFYLNKEKVIFDPDKFYHFNANTGKRYSIEVTPAKRGGIKILYVKSKAARFVIIPAAKNKFVRAGIANGVGIVSNGPGQGVNVFVLGYKKNDAIEINYDLGRFLAEIYK